MYRPEDGPEPQRRAAYRDPGSSAVVQLPERKNLRFSSPWIDVATLVVSTVAFGLLSVALGQDANWDLRNYHFYNAYAFLNDRLRFDFAPAQIQTYLNPLLDILTFWLIEVLPPRGVGFMLGAVQGLNFWLVYSIARAVLHPCPAVLEIALALGCAALGCYGVVGISELGTVFHDLTTSTFVLLAVLLFITASLRRPDVADRGSLVRIALAGVAIGIGVGVKYTLAIYPIGFGVAILVASPSWRERWLRGSVWGAGAVVGLALGAGYWMLLMYEEFGSPLFPFYNAIFRSPYMEPVNFVETRFLPTTLTKTLLYPIFFTSDKTTAMEHSFQDLRLAVVYALIAATLPTALVDLLRRARAKAGAPSRLSVFSDTHSAKWLLTFFAVSYAVWQIQFSIYRYIAPLEQLAPLVIVILCGALYRDRIHALVMSLLAFGFVAATLRAPDWGRVSWGAKFVDVRLPAGVDLSSSTIVMTSLEPFSYVIPSFPAQTRFVRIESSFFTPDHRTKMAEEIAVALQDPGRSYHLLTTSASVEAAATPLSHYSMHVVSDSCASVTSNLDSNLVLCRVARDGDHRPGVVSRVERTRRTSEGSEGR
jgi:hypothetical protein